MILWTPAANHRLGLLPAEVERWPLLAGYERMVSAPLAVINIDDESHWKL